MNGILFKKINTLFIPFEYCQLSLITLFVCPSQSFLLTFSTGSFLITPSKNILHTAHIENVSKYVPGIDNAGLDVNIFLLLLFFEFTIFAAPGASKLKVYTHIHTFKIVKSKWMGNCKVFFLIELRACFVSFLPPKMAIHSPLN